MRYLPCRWLRFPLVYKQAIHERIQAGAPTLKDPLALVFERADDLFGNDEFHAPTGEYNFVLDDPQIFDPRLSQFLLPRFVQRPVLSFVGINSMLVRTDWSNDQILYMTRDWAFRWSALAVATVVHKPNTIAGKRARSFAHNFGRTTPESMAQMWERAGLDVQVGIILSPSHSSEKHVQQDAKDPPIGGGWLPLLCALCLVDSGV